MKWLLSLIFTLSLAAENVKTSHQIEVGSELIRYEATVGSIPLKSESGELEGEIFYTSYVKEGEGRRPVTFCFNGGPGSSSVWLHLGAFGPKTVARDEQGVPEKPGRLIDNPRTLLQFSDLVFIDPISTGCSRASSPEQERKFLSVDGDIQSISDFIESWVSQNERWDSPKYLAGESYGTLRAAGVAHHLLTTRYLQVDGIILISAILNYQDHFNGSDEAYIHALPTLTAIAHYHGKVEGELDVALGRAERFAETEYLKTLFQGRQVSQSQKQKIAAELSFLTGMEKEYCLKSNLRLKTHLFVRNIVEDSVVSMYDGSWIEEDFEPCNPYRWQDPGDQIFPVFTKLMNQYLRGELNWKGEREYRILPMNTNMSWDFELKNAYLNSATKLEELLQRAPEVAVYLGGGIYDAVTPYFAAFQTLNHLVIREETDSKMMMRTYKGGHMYYLSKEGGEQFFEDLEEFFNW